MDYMDIILKNIVLEDKEQVLKYKETGEDFKYHPRWRCFKCHKLFFLFGEL